MRRTAGVLLSALAFGAVWLLLSGPTAAAGGEPPIVVTTADDVVDGGDGLLSLREAVTQAELDGIDAAIQLAAGTTYELDLCGPAWEGAEVGDNGLNGLDHHGADPLELVGAVGTLIDQTCSQAEVVDAAGDLLLRDLTLTGGSGTGAAAVSTGASVELDGVHLDGNGPDGNGQVEGLVVSEGPVVITDSVIEDAGVAGEWDINFAVQGDPLTITRSAIREIRGATAVTLGWTDTTITDSEISDNEVHLGAVSTLCDTTVTGSSFARNTNVWWNEPDEPSGGAIVGIGVVDVTDTDFVDNHSAGSGGAINAPAVNVTGGEMRGNTADEWGGAVAAVELADFGALQGRTPSCGAPPEPLTGSVTLSGATVEDSQGGDGAAIFAGGSATFTETDVTGSASVEPPDGSDAERFVGNVVHADDAVAITGGTISGNSTDEGFVVAAYGALQTDGVTVVDNTSAGSALFSDGVGGMTVLDSELRDNEGIIGAVLARCDLVLDGVTATGNHATEIAGVGGSEATVFVVDSTLGGNTSDGDGGAVVGSAVWVEGSTVADNDAAGDGGGLVVDVLLKDRPGDCVAAPGLPTPGEGMVHVERSTVSGNEAGGDGGGVQAYGGFVEVERSTVSGNQAAGDGGGLAASFEVLVSDSTITANRAGRGGGLAVVHADGEAHVDASTINANAATHADDLAAPTLVLSGAAVGSPQALGGDCEVDVVESQGSIVVDPACIGSGHGDLVVPALGLGDLTDNGGDTLTRMPAPSSPLVDHSFPACAHFSLYDQRDVFRYQSGNGCDTGAVESPWTRFLDVSPAHPFFDEITGLASDDVIAGYDDRRFRPSSTVTRQAGVAWLYRLSGSPTVAVPTPPTFSDVGSGHPFLEEVEWAASAGVTEGYADGTFRPSAGVSRQALVAWLFDLVGPDVDPPAEATFDDVSPGHPFFAEVEWAAAEGLVNGYGDGTFRPGQTVTRQAAAAILDRSQQLVAPT